MEQSAGEMVTVPVTVVKRLARVKKIVELQGSLGASESDLSPGKLAFRLAIHGDCSALDALLGCRAVMRESPEFEDVHVPDQVLEAAGIDAVQNALKYSHTWRLLLQEHLSAGEVAAYFNVFDFQGRA